MDKEDSQKNQRWFGQGLLLQMFVDVDVDVDHNNNEDAAHHCKRERRLCNTDPLRAWFKNFF